MNGATTLVKTMLASGVDTCFANPGTSEMHFVAALDSNPDMRCVLCLFEGGATGAADGYARMTGNVASTLLHLGPGFGNGWANLHNARKALSGILNVVGDHATYHLRHEAPLKGDLEGVARSVSHWTRVSPDAAVVAADGAAAIRAARSNGGQIATLILPADTAWGAAKGSAMAAPPPQPHRPSSDRIKAAARRLARPGAALLVSGPALFGPLAETAGRIAARTGCRLIAPFFAPRIRCGAGSVLFEQMKYAGDQNAELLDGLTDIVLVGETPPVNFFAYPGKPSTPEPAGCAVDRLCDKGWDVAWTFEALAGAAGVDGREAVGRHTLALPDAPAGPLTPESVGMALARYLPEEAIVVNEAVTAGAAIWPQTVSARPHDRINTTGGSIGQCLPAAVGAAVACPDRPVVAVSGDGSAMYTIQALWTMAREGLDVTVLILANRGYRILRGEMANLGVERYGQNAARMFDIEQPELDFVALASGHGVPGERVTTAEALSDALARSSSASGPALIEAIL
jgi:acetolactate synthase-1/2/3 large subunit